ncbi:MAG TPA: hypothetical protein VMT99_02570 [Candidatus Paceibacterota bacterium]|nr:hypothetical protein [Candidatus Paceibacterota bacterium]
MANTTLNLNGAPGPTGTPHVPPRPGSVRPRGMRTFVKWFLVIVVIAVAAWGLSSYAAARSSWQAVFLTNNQVYFGHFSHVPFSSTVTLTDVYYLQVAPNAQDLSGATDQSNLKLVRLGSEIHGPTDAMVIPMGQIFFWETLRPDSAVVAAIKSLSH